MLFYSGVLNYLCLGHSLLPTALFNLLFSLCLRVHSLIAKTRKAPESFEPLRICHDVTVFSASCTPFVCNCYCKLIGTEFLNHKMNYLINKDSFFC